MALLLRPAGGVRTLSHLHHPALIALPRRLLQLPSLVLVVVLSAVATGCGSGDLDPDSVAEAAETTRQEGTARVRYEIDVSGMELLDDVAIDGEGVTALDSTSMDLTFDVSTLLSASGIDPFGQADDTEARMIVADGQMFLDPPTVEGADLPGDDRWVGVDLARLFDAAGINPDGLAALMTVTPEASLAALEVAGGMKTVGEEEVDGVTTTHFRGAIRTEDYIETLPPERRGAARRALVELLEASDTKDTPSPMEVWVDGEGRVRRIRCEAVVPASKGVPSGHSAVDMTYSDFGTDARIAAPPAHDTFDATELVAGEIRKAP